MSICECERMHALFVHVCMSDWLAMGNGVCIEKGIYVTCVCLGVSMGGGCKWWI